MKLLPSAFWLLLATQGVAYAQSTTYLWQYPETSPLANDLMIMERSPGGSVPSPTVCSVSGTNVCTTYSTTIGQLLQSVKDGSASAPSIAFSNAPTTGFYRNTSTGDIIATVNGSQTFDFGASSLSYSGAITTAGVLSSAGIQTGLGSAAGPAYGFQSHGNTGWYYQTTAGLSALTAVGSPVNLLFSMAGQSSPITLPNEGVSFGWDYTGTTSSPEGETDLFLGPGGAGGGLNIYQLTVYGQLASGQSAGNPIWGLDGSGDTTQHGNSAANSFIMNSNGCSWTSCSSPGASQYFAGYTNVGLYQETSNTVGFMANGSASLWFGGHGDPSYPKNAVIMNDSEMALHGDSMGCGDQAAVLTIYYTPNIFGSDYSIPVHAGANGCPTGTTAQQLQTLGGEGFESVAEYIQGGSGNPPVVQNISSFTTTTATFSTPISASLAARIQPYMYVLTNWNNSSGHPYGSYILSATTTTLNVLGWMAINTSGNTSSTPLVPGAQSGDVYAPLPWTYYGYTEPAGSNLSNTNSQVYIGQSTSYLDTDEVCARGPGEIVAIDYRACREIDVIDYQADVPLNQGNIQSGYSFLSLGTHHPGNGIYLAGNGGDVSDFNNDLAVGNFYANGVYVIQACTTCGSVQPAWAVHVSNLDGFNTQHSGAFLLDTSSGQSLFSIDAYGNTIINGTLTLNSNTTWTSVSSSPTSYTSAGTQTGSGGKCVGINLSTHQLYISTTNCN